MTTLDREVLEKARKEVNAARAGRDVARFDSTDAWLIFALWAGAEGHIGLCVTALVITAIYLWAIADAEKEARVAALEDAK